MEIPMEIHAWRSLGLRVHEWRARPGATLRLVTLRPCSGHAQARRSGAAAARVAGAGADAWGRGRDRVQMPGLGLGM